MPISIDTLRSASFRSGLAKSASTLTEARSLGVPTAFLCHEIRKVRNNVHPGVWSRDRSDPLRFTKGVYGVVDEVLDVANSWLLHRVEKNLLKALKKEDKKKAAIAAETAAP
jgi:hypothetical protein